MAAKWKRVGENLVRHRAGQIYLRAKVGGKISMQSLKTPDLRVAKLKRNEILPKLRAAAAKAQAPAEVRTLEDALRVLEARTVAPHLKESTRHAYRQTFETLRETLPLRLHGRSWGEVHAARWWKTITDRYGASRANMALVRIRQLQAVLIEHGVRDSDATRHLRRMRAPRTIRDMPSRESIEAVIADVRAQNKRVSEQVGNFIAFIAYSGTRVSEARSVTWEDISDDWITVRGPEASGTKNREERQVPICPPMRELLEGMRWERASGPLFFVKSPRFALSNACERLGLAPLTPHWLRHWFATWALESGVDVRTVAGWLGHKDNGALLLKTYSHLRADHSLKQAEKLGG